MVYDRQRVRRRPRTGDLARHLTRVLARSKGQDHTGISCSQVSRDANAALLALLRQADLGSRPIAWSFTANSVERAAKWSEDSCDKTMSARRQNIHGLYACF
jgi:hypothetical protein